MAPLVVIAGTGTGVGKTYVASALLRAWGEGACVVGYKPVETGVAHIGSPTGVGSPFEEGEDARALREASTFHVKHSLFQHTFADPVSPHLAARRAGASIDLAPLVEQASRLRGEADGVVVELAGGLFTPLAAGVFNLHLARAFAPTRIVVVAPDRLGVLHDVGATLHAARHFGLELSGVVLGAVMNPDASSGTNAQEIIHAFGARTLEVFPYAPCDAGAAGRAGRRLLAALELPVRESAAMREDKQLR
jgi:dethiobiotin synthetase